ncbi:MAG: nucleoside monophosphate kinase [Clostridia bacterium]|nr:nucleoside monophosphate kinase [Clostridia bacterium]
MKLILIGAPGAGKGTLSVPLKEKLGIPTISTGDLLRDAIANQTEEGIQAKSFMDRGALVPTEVVFEMLKKRLQEPDAKNGYILDGFPRNLEQVKLLESYTDIDYVIDIEIGLDVILERLLGRRVCPKCKYIYNTSWGGDSVHCAKCGAEYITRSDDNEETITKRYNLFVEETEPVIDHYKKLGKVIEIKSSESEEVKKQAFDALGIN